MNDYIDKVVVFNSKEDLEENIKRLQPCYMVVGSDWREKEVVGEQYCTKLEFFDRIEGYSTTNILQE